MILTIFRIVFSIYLSNYFSQYILNSKLGLRNVDLIRISSYWSDMIAKYKLKVTYSLYCDE